jgi:SAM-dependent methyltransferase
MSQRPVLRDFYEETYTESDPTAAAAAGRWRALGAEAKALHVLSLLELADIEPARLADVGCGDGAVMTELRRRRPGLRLVGFELAERAVLLCRRRGLEAVLYDGRSLPVAEGAFDAGVVSHVLEHVEDPVALIREVGRACRAVVLEVPLEANLSARRPSKRAGAEQVGHVQRFDRRAVRELVGAAGLECVRELADPLPLAAHMFHARAPRQRLAALLKAAVRRTLFTLAPTLAERAFTVHYACLAVPRDERRA